MTRLSVQLYSVRDQFAADPLATLQRLAGIGFTDVEPYGLVQHLDALRNALPQTPLSAPTAHVSLVGADLDAVFAAAVACGIGVVIEPAVREPQWQDAAGVAATAAALNDAAKAAEGQGLRVGYHNHWWELQAQIDGRPALEVLADQLDPAVLLEVDTYWATAGGVDAPELLHRLGDRVHALHIKDGDLSTDASGQVPAGQGRVPVAEVLAAAPDALRVVEFDRYDGDIFTALAESHAYLAGTAR
jgi:sugar phosphate isomerase/epimerase